MTTQLLGWFASTLVFATFCARQMIALRVLAIASNLAFIAYGYQASLWPIVGLHLAMLPINILRVRQLVLACQEEGNDAGRSPISFVASVRLLAGLMRLAAKPRAAV
ncbi:MAG TPA: hypothetical protein VM782_18940 [Stellaceae bacterium]|nr:hypothetical protein [Stellaceae bacterium]